MLGREKIMNSQKTFSLKSAQQGVVLIEAMTAILIFSMGVLAVVGLQAAMIKNTADSEFRTDASYIAQQRIGQMWLDSNNLTAYVENATNISTLLPNGTRTTAQSGVQFTVTVAWQQPGQAQHSFTTTASIAGG
jgi:type IV pilus assembly protein PilV